MAVSGMHAESGYVHVLAFRNVMGGQLLEIAFGHHQVDLVRDIEHKRRDDQRVVVHEAIGTDH